uniref:PTS sugar transporter subunit IIA n=1 Tax=Enterocloster clostridioformis TaxID=1531 RepID=UPI001C3D72FE|nr:PTS glucose transporter subunit IIA [Enterocloster clostridioformis]
MGLFNFLKDKDKSKGQVPAPAAVTAAFPAVLGAPAKGTFVTMDKIPDEVFSTGVLGTCCGVDPEEGKVYATADGKISQLTDTLHAVGLEAGGVEILIHVGVDTVDMNGDGFANSVKLGQNVKKGDLLLTMDLDKIRAAGHPTTVIMAVTNSDDLRAVEVTGTGAVQPGEDIVRISK